MDMIVGVVTDFLTSAGPGGIVVMGVLVIACIVYYSILRWILKGSENNPH